MSFKITIKVVLKHTFISFIVSAEDRRADERFIIETVGRGTPQAEPAWHAIIRAVHFSIPKPSPTRAKPQARRFNHPLC
jgi:hypothetical protein